MTFQKPTRHNWHMRRPMVPTGRKDATGKPAMAFGPKSVRCLKCRAHKAGNETTQCPGRSPRANRATA